MRTILKKLLQIPSVSGREARLGKYISEEMRPYFDTVETDALGNVICRKRGEGKKLLFCAHMDEIGFIVTFIEEDGFLRCAPVGGIDLHAAAYSKVVFENGRVGVLIPEEGVKPEDYKGLMVRVAGYMAYFTELDKSAQDAIIYRTPHLSQN